MKVSSLIAAHRHGDAESLQALAAALAAVLAPVPELPVDPVEHLDAADVRGAGAEGSWQEVRAARDHGDLTGAEYEYLAAAVDALTQEETA